jgi:Inner membrane protein YgaP-like, transmembrane domain
MNVERYLRLIAGVVVLISIVLAVKVSLWFLAFAAFVGVNLTQSAFTNWCPVMTFLRKAGVPDTLPDVRSTEPVA